MKRVWEANKVINRWDGRPLQIPKAVDPENENSEVIPADVTTADVFKMIVNRAQYKTEEDGKESRRILEALEESKKSGEIVLDEGTHRWLVNQAKVVIWPLFRWNGEAVNEVIKKGKDMSDGT